MLIFFMGRQIHQVRVHSIQLMFCFFLFFFPSSFNDIHVPVRLECVKFASHCLMNHPDLARDLTGALKAVSFLSYCFATNFGQSVGQTSFSFHHPEYLKVRSHDPEEAIRHDVIVTIINAGKKDLNLVNDQLLGFVRERTLDKRVRQTVQRKWNVQMLL